MIKGELKIQTIEPSEGHYLTQAQDVDLLNRILTKNKIYLSALDKPENWKEITDAEAVEIKKQQNEAKANRK